MQKQSGSQIRRFGVFDVDLSSGELRKSGVRIRLQEQPFRILCMLMDRPGEVVTREEIQKRLWPEGTFVDFDHSIGTAVKKLRQTLGDDAGTPRFIETIPRRGYRFVAPLDIEIRQPSPRPMPRRRWLRWALVGAALVVAMVVAIYARRQPRLALSHRSLVRLSAGSGLQFGPTWSPDGRFVAYSSDRGGKFDIWVQQVGGLEPVRITTLPGQNWQPDWSPDGNLIVFRSEGEPEGLFVVPALGGPAKKIASFGYRPRWSPSGRQIMFTSTVAQQLWNKLFVVGLDGQPPREILVEFFNHADIAARSAAWFPPGDRISVWGRGYHGGFSFWTAPIAGGRALKSELSGEVADQFKEINFGGGEDFVWSPSRRAIYFAASSRGVQNLWRVTVDPATLRWKSLERMTTGPGPDNDLAISHNGKKLAFTASVEQTRVWSFPFDAIAGRVTAKGQPVTPAGVDAWMPDISPDGTRLVYMAERSGKLELWEQSLTDARRTLLADDGDMRAEPRWSPDGERIAYSLHKPDQPSDCRSMPAGGSTEQILSSGKLGGFCTDWSPDGQWVITSRWIAQREYGGPGYLMRLLPVSAAPHAETRARLVASSREDGFYQMHVSPNGQWIVFEAVRGAAATNARLYTILASGGPWTPITDGNSWDDKPRWAPDGKAIYFVSSRKGSLNVWGIRFDAVRGVPLGEPFRVTAFESPGLRVFNRDISRLQLSVAANRLVLPMTESSGSIWVIENAEQ